MKIKISAAFMGLLIVAGVMVVSGFVNMPALAASPEKRVKAAQAAQIEPAETSAVQIEGTYSGVVDLNVTVGGVFSDTLVMPPADAPAPPDLGVIDLALELTQAGQTLSGHVSLEKTLVFDVEHTVGTGANTVEIGPFVNGKIDGANLSLVSEKVSTVLGGRTIERQFRLTGTTTSSDGSKVSGEYRETLWGYTNAPVTVIGAFSLQRPVFSSTVPGSSNESPTSVADTATTPQGVAVTINVLANDTDPGGDALTVTSVSKPQFGTATTNGKTVTYTPNADFVGNDNFSYFISDGKGGEATGSVTIKVGQTGGETEGQSIYLPLIVR